MPGLKFRHETTSKYLYKRIDMKTVYILLLPILVLLVLIGLNYRQVISAWMVRAENSRLEKSAMDATEEYSNPAPLEDKFQEGLSPNFWSFSIINGAGKISHEDTWHAAAMTLHDGLSINHIPDTDFNHESADMAHQPAAEQYNNLTLIGARGFRPTPSSDVVLRFSSRVSESFYGTAGVIFQPVGTLQEDGIFAKPFDMFGFSVAGEESSIQGVNGGLCYLALNWLPVTVNALPVDVQDWHEYEIRLRWLSKTKWQGIVKVDDATICEMDMPAFGTVEVHVWSDNSLVPSMDLQFQDGGNKEFALGHIQIFAEAR
jgi:hypothetical protein